MQSLMKKTSRAASGTLLLAAALATGACGLLPQKTEVAPGVTQQTGQFEFALPSGEYRCERGERLQIRRELANAVNNQELNRQNLYVAEVYANPGPTLKRYVARSRGSASPMLKRTSHISVVLDQK